MALSQTVTLTHGREFGGSNPGVRLDDSADPVALDPGFFTAPDAAETAGAFVKATFRAETAWLHVNADLWLDNIDGHATGARTDLMLDLYSPTTDRWCRLDLSGYTAAASRGDGLAQVNFDLATAVPTNVAGRTYQSLRDWATQVEAALPHDVDITFTSASSTPHAPPAASGIALGGTDVAAVYVGDTMVERVYVGTGLLFGAAPGPAASFNTLYLVGQVLDDVWSLDGTTWSKVADAPTGENGPTDVAFDSAGTLHLVGQSLDDVWSHDGSAWSKVADAPPGEGQPHGMAFGPNDVLHLTGINTEAVWSWDGSTWSKVADAPATETLCEGIAFGPAP